MNDLKHLSAEEFLQSLDPDGAEIVTHMRAISSAVTDDLVNLLYGRVFQREGLDLRSRFLVTVAAVAACGDMGPQLAYQSKLALKNGVSFDEIMEVLLQISVFCGFSRGVNAMKIVDAVRASLSRDPAG